MSWADRIAALFWLSVWVWTLCLFINLTERYPKGGRRG